MKDHADAAAKLVDLDLAVDVHVPHLDGALHLAALDEVVHAVEAAQQGALAAARGADEGGHLVGGDLHVDVFERLKVGIEQIDVLYADVGALDGFTHAPVVLL